MNVKDVMQQLAARLQTITTFQQVNDRPVDSVVVPAAVVTLPEQVTFDETYGRGMDRITVPVLVLVGKVSDTAARDQVLAYANATGAQSVKQIVESGTYTAFDVVRVMRVEFDVVTIGAVDYLAATFTLDIAGQGA